MLQLFFEVFTRSFLLLFFSFILVLFVLSYIKALEDIFIFFLIPLRDLGVLSDKLWGKFEVVKKITTEHIRFLEAMENSDNLPKLFVNKLDFLKM